MKNLNQILALPVAIDKYLDLYALVDFFLISNLG